MSGHQVVLVRHGQTEWSLSGQHAGSTDIPLTEAGRRQALALDDRLSRWRFERVLSSPLARALDTCRLAGMAERADLTDDLKEWDYGEYEGRRTVDIRKERPGWNLWLDGAPGGQTVEAVGRQADRVMEVIRAAPGDVAVFAHGHLLRVLAARWVGLPPDHGRLLALSTASLSVLGWERETAVVERWNDPADN